MGHWFVTACRSELVEPKMAAMDKDDDCTSPGGSAAQRVELNALWTKAYPLVFGFIRSAVWDFHAAEDIMQEVAASVAEKFEDYDRSRPFTPWAIGIARNKILMHLRATSRDRHVFNEQVIGDVAAAWVNLSGELLDRRSALETCVKKIEGRSRKMLEMRYTRDMSPTSIAKTTGMTANAVSTLLHRIRQVLRDCIERELNKIARVVPQGKK